jgi:hypothetical protein
MSGQLISKKSDLLKDIERDWNAINTFLADLTESQWTGIKNADNWAIKDHVAHLSAWENSVIAFLTGTPRHEGLGVAENLYLNEGIDAINAQIFKTHANDSLAQVKAQFQKTHSDLMQIIDTLSDDDLKKPYSHYLPDEPGEGDGPPAIKVIYGNTAHHYREHQGWMETMLNSV